jgi:hypothetical protein
MKIGPMKYVAVLMAALLAAVAVDAWAKARMFATNAVTVEKDLPPPAPKLRGGALHQEPMLY